MTIEYGRVAECRRDIGLVGNPHKSLPEIMAETPNMQVRLLPRPLKTECGVGWECWNISRPLRQDRWHYVVPVTKVVALKPTSVDPDGTIVFTEI